MSSDSPVSPHRKWWQQPLLHFLIAGALIFALNCLRGDAGTDRFEIVVSAQQIERLASLWEQSWGRAPTEEELEQAIQDHIREEVYYREALSLGLDGDDAVIRRRMRQKMEFMLVGDIADPTTEQLTTFYNENIERYTIGPLYHFEQVYLGNDDPLDAAWVIEALNGGSEPAAAGRNIDLPRAMSRVDARDISRVYGREFALALAELPAKQWAGPVPSGFGVHVVRLLETLPAVQQPFEQVGRKVTNDWKAAERRNKEQAVFDEISAPYEVSIQRTGSTDS